MTERPRLAYADGHSAGDAADPLRLQTEGLTRPGPHQAAKFLYVALVFPRRLNMPLTSVLVPPPSGPRQLISQGYPPDPVNSEVRVTEDGGGPLGRPGSGAAKDQR